MPMATVPQLANDDSVPLKSIVSKKRCSSMAKVEDEMVVLLGLQSTPIVLQVGAMSVILMRVAVRDLDELPLFPQEMLKLGKDNGNPLQSR